MYSDKGTRSICKCNSLPTAFNPFIHDPFRTLLDQVNHLHPVLACLSTAKQSINFSELPVVMYFVLLLLMVRFGRSPVAHKLHSSNDFSNGEETNQFCGDNSSTGDLCSTQVSNSIGETG